MFLWNDEDVGGRLRSDVFEGENVLVLVHFLAGNFAADDAAEETAARGI